MTQQELQTRLKAIGFLMKGASPEQVQKLQMEVDALIGFSPYGDEEFEESSESLGAWEAELRKQEDGF